MSLLVLPGPVRRVHDALRHRAALQLRDHVAGADATRRADSIWGKTGERWFGPADPIWRVHLDAAMFVAGIRALLLQSLHPLAMAGVDQHSSYREDPWGRLQLTSNFISTTTFGTVPDAERLLARVRGHLEDFLPVAHALVHAPLGPDETVTSRHETAVAEYSQLLDKLGSTLGVQAQSIPGLHPHGGLLGRVHASVLAGTFLVNLGFHLPAWWHADGLAAWVNGTFAVADGWVDGCLCVGAKPWDVAGGAAIARARGLAVLGAGGREFTFDSPVLAAGHPALARELIAVWESMA